MSSKTYNTILFDLDGTLLDTNELILSSFLHVFDQYIPEKGITREEIIPHMGKTLVDMMRIFHHEQTEELVHAYRKYNHEQHDQMVTAFPFVVEVIDALHNKGIQMGIVTTKQRSTVEMGLKLCGLSDYFKSVVTIQDVEHPKPHPEPVQKGIAELHAAPETTLMVGDSPFDIQAAQGAGIDSAGVAWTLKGAEYLEAYKPTHMLHSMKDLLKLV